jgi:glycosyltransferase involved in cell wall biosynthesis
VNEGFDVIISSDKKNKILRLLDMCITFFRNKNSIDILLIDTFSTTNFYFAFILSQLARRNKVDYVPILHGGNLPNRISNSPKMSRKVFDNSLINIAPSNYLKLAFEKKGFKTKLIPNILEVDNYKFKERNTFSPNLLWVRAFDKTYNPLMAIKVLNEVKKEFSNAKLCMIGPQKDETLEMTQKLINDIDLTDSVEITGVLPKEEWHKKSEKYDIFINTTNFDNTPVSVIEVMALGLPVVTTNVGGIPFLIEDNIDGKLVEIDNVDQMAKVIIELIKSPEETRALVKNARVKVENFDWKFIRNRWLEVLG